MAPIPLAIQTIYSELVQQAHAAAERPGSVYRRTLKGAEYIYVKRSVGTTRRDIFIGRADAPDAQSRAKAIAEENRRAKERRKLVTALIAGGIPAPVRQLGAVLDVLDDAGILQHTVVVGTSAYQCYAAIVGHVLSAATLMTQDADLATASLAIAADAEGETMEDVLKRADPTFRAVPGLKRNALPSSFRSGSGFVVDILTPQLRRTDKNPVPLRNLGAGAVPMQHLRWLTDQPVRAVALYAAGVPLSVPQPARFAVHKLLLAQKRKVEPSKRAKDLLQAKELIAALGSSDPWSLTDALADATRQGRAGWRQPIERSLAELDLRPRDILKPGG